MEILILKLIIGCYILPIIIYYFLTRYLFNSKIYDKELLDYRQFYLMFVPIINILGNLLMILAIIENKNFLHKFFKLK